MKLSLLVTLLTLSVPALAANAAKKPLDWSAAIPFLILLAIPVVAWFVRKEVILDNKKKE